MQRYQNIQRTIATERPEKDSGNQSCEQVPGGGSGGGGSDSEAESSQSSLGKRGRGAEAVTPALPRVRMAWGGSGRKGKRLGAPSGKHTGVSHQERKGEVNSQ